MNARPVLWAGCPEAAQAVRQLCPQAAADALGRAGEICGHTFLFRDHWEMEPTREPVHFDGPVVWDAVPAGDPEWTYALNRHTIFVHLGRAWQYTGQARYLDAFVSLLGDWLDRVPRTPASENTTWRALEAGLRPRLQPGGRCPGPPAGRPGCGRRDGPGVGAQSGRPLPGGACAGVHRGRPAPAARHGRSRPHPAGRGGIHRPVQLAGGEPRRRPALRRGLHRPRECPCFHPAVPPGALP